MPHRLRSDLRSESDCCRTLVSWLLSNANAGARLARRIGRLANNSRAIRKPGHAVRDNVSEGINRPRGYLPGDASWTNLPTNVFGQQRSAYGRVDVKRSASTETMKSSEQPLDLLILGAGVYGIYAARTYLELHPAATIKVLDSDKDVGGVWSRSRLYPQFWSQSGARLSGFPDVPFELPEGAPLYHDLFEAKYLAQYLEDYVTNHDYAGRSLRDRFVFECWVRDVRKSDELWSVQADVAGEERRYAARKIIVATGLTSIPAVPTLPGREVFDGPIIHQKDFGKSGILTSDEPEPQKHTNITVLGGSKSAADIVYAAATDSTLPRTVNWIIRTSGQGPLLLTAAKGFGKYKSLPEVGSIRATANLSVANPFLPVSWWSWFIHKTVLGNWLLGWIWRQNEEKSKALANYHRREGALPGFDGLDSPAQLRWRSGYLGLTQRDDFWDVIAKRVQVHRADLIRLEKNEVVLKTGVTVKTNVLLCATGWEQTYSFFDASEAARLGLPLDINNKTAVQAERQHWSRLDEIADGKVLERWPYLIDGDSLEKIPTDSTPYRLYNLTVSPSDTSIAFLGVSLVPNSYHTALSQTLYAIAVLDGVLKLPRKQEMEEDIAYKFRWCARRYPVHGFKGNIMDFEMVSFTDHLLDQLGLESHRNRDSWWKDMTDPCLASDYAGLVNEYRRKYMPS